MVTGKTVGKHIFIEILDEEGNKLTKGGEEGSCWQLCTIKQYRL